MDIHLRPARPGDGALMLEVARASVEGLTGSHYDAEQIAAWTRDRTPAYYEPDIATGRTIIAEKAGRAVGFVSSVPGELTRLFITPEVAGQGLGARLVRFGIALACAETSRPVILQATLNARRFYERNGFVYQSDGAYAHGTGGMPVRIVNMILAPSHYPAERRSVSQIMEAFA
ncbi:GNAT family N-acetyltransferase [Frigidibacter sp. RF13]|uniref:GNAT family N-acetyltransferase n=1 Tax=Frigidibacter sp. RF13 TaxID=2997340 RepID=UPI00227189E8|nr:GNAT family N-acetyltransferase [Frigidibacter sp. RF13]MCY1125674.1 GNAT family N-acetyltransferase [Frigidibacter sp. RF13]